MTTLEELKSIGIHGDNLIELSLPTFFHNPLTNEITSEWSNGFDNTRYHMTTRRLFPKSDEFQCHIDEINNAKLVFWMPCIGSPDDIALWFRRAMLQTYQCRLNLNTTVKLIEIDGFSWTDAINKILKLPPAHPNHTQYNWTDALNKMQEHYKVREEDIEFVKIVNDGTL